MRKVLVIKHGRPGDFVQATGIFADMRAHEKDAHITLLTTPKMRVLAENSPFYDDVVYDACDSWFKPQTWKTLRKTLTGFDMVYDLQNSARTKLYHLIAGCPTWCGNTPLAKYKQNIRKVRGMHTFRRLQNLVELAGVKTGHWPNLDYARADDSAELKDLGFKKYVVLVPGSSAASVHKRWPHYADLAKKLQLMGHNCLLLGGPDEVDLLAALSAQTGAAELHKNPLSQVIDLLARADFVVGNDTSMLHIAAAVGVKSVTIFGGAVSGPGKSAATGKHAKVVYKSHIGAITSNDVLRALEL